ncbi:MAG: ATP-binding cassette domain-containing protein [Clostridia bacterium]|nr:ATP-binding cassette domain-containing protein [Clostridia bacterium]
MATVIRVENLTKTFGEGDGSVEALKHIDLNIEEGDIYGIIGLSGAGKSTLVRCMNLLERPTSGRIIVNGKDLMQLSEKELNRERKSIGMIFQHFNLLMQRTCLDNITFPLELNGTPRKQAVARARELLRIVDLESKENAYPVQLSGGQKQRIAIARTLATNPKVLLCDEATSALDPKTTRDILKLIREINAKLGITVVIITHDMHVVNEICTHVAILNNGHIEESGRVDEVFSHPKSEAGMRLVYPDGVRTELLPENARVVRLAFNGGNSAYEPVISSLAVDCGIKVNILGADIRTIDGVPCGTMLLELPKNDAEAQRALEYLGNCTYLTCEEVTK